MKKQKIKDIATTLIHAYASRLDFFAFYDTDISDCDRDAILDEITRQCDNSIGKMESKYNTEIITSNTADIVNTIIKSATNQ